MAQSLSMYKSIVDNTLDYISNQVMHHKRFSFQDEYRQFGVSYGVEYDEAYVLIKAFALSGRVFKIGIKNETTF